MQLLYTLSNKNKRVSLRYFLQAFHVKEKKLYAQHRAIFFCLKKKRKLKYSVHVKAIYKIPVFMQSIYRAGNDTGWIDKIRRVKANRISDVSAFFSVTCAVPEFKHRWTMMIASRRHKHVASFFRCERYLNHFETMFSVQGGLVALGCRSLTLFHNPHDGLRRPGSYPHVIARRNRKTQREYLVSIPRGISDFQVAALELLSLKISWDLIAKLKVNFEWSKIIWLLKLKTQ